MAYGTANVDTIQSSTAGTPVQFNDGNGTQVGTLCRAWVRFTGSTAVIGASFNVTSVTRNGTGDYTVNFTNAMPDANYVVTSNSWGAASQNGVTFGAGGYAPTTSSIRVIGANVYGTILDVPYAMIAVFR
jgi:hypothetical protein